MLYLLFFAGLLSGFIDAIAGGGGLISVPALLWAGLPVQTALGTNKLQAACGTLLAVTRFARAGWIDWRDMRLAIGVTFGFAALGTLAVTQLSQDLLKVIVPWLLLAVAIYALLSPRLGLQRTAAKLSGTTFAILGGVLLGFYDGFFGPGTGSFWTIALLSLRGFELTRATAYTKVVNLTSNLASLVVFLWAGSVVFNIALAMIAGQLIGARLGSGLVLKHGAPLVRVVFLVVVFTLTAKLLWDLW
ncbi:MAG: TSUP family transporter [Verrucomicrobiota bacterium]